MFKTLIGAVALTAIAIPAAAAESRVVRHDDLNLATPEGMQTLDRRIDLAARNVCGASSSRIVALEEIASVRACMTEAKAKAAKQVAARIAGDRRGG